MTLTTAICEILGKFCMALCVAFLAAFLLLEWRRLVRWVLPTYPEQPDLKYESLFWWSLLSLAVGMACQVGKMGL